MEFELEGIDARVVQHESDHLDGIMFTERVTSETLAELQPMVDDFISQFNRAQESGEVASNEDLKARLKELEAERTG